MRTPEDPCRDPASEARDDHASEPRATPETDAESFSTPYQGELVKASFARRLERQRDGLMEALEATAKFVELDSPKTAASIREVIAAVKGGRDV
jgi:hypothetical protein